MLMVSSDGKVEFLVSFRNRILFGTRRQVSLTAMQHVDVLRATQTIIKSYMTAHANRTSTIFVKKYNLLCPLREGMK